MGPVKVGLAAAGSQATSRLEMAGVAMPLGFPSAPEILGTDMGSFWVDLAGSPATGDPSFLVDFLLLPGFGFN